MQKRTELDAEHQTQRDRATNLTPDERKSQMDAERTALETWAKDNGIDMQYLMPHGGRGHGGFGGPGNRPDTAPVSPTTTQ